MQPASRVRLCQGVTLGDSQEAVGVQRVREPLGNGRKEREGPRAPRSVKGPSAAKVARVCVGTKVCRGRSGNLETKDAHSLRLCAQPKVPSGQRCLGWRDRGGQGAPVLPGKGSVLHWRCGSGEGLYLAHCEAMECPATCQRSGYETVRETVCKRTARWPPRQLSVSSHSPPATSNRVNAAARGEQRASPACNLP